MVAFHLGWDGTSDMCRNFPDDNLVTKEYIVGEKCLEETKFWIRCRVTQDLLPFWSAIGDQCLKDYLEEIGWPVAKDLRAELSVRVTRETPVFCFSCWSTPVTGFLKFVHLTQHQCRQLLPHQSCPWQINSYILTLIREKEHWVTYRQILPLTLCTGNPLCCCGIIGNIFMKGNIHRDKYFFSWRWHLYPFYELR